MDIKTDMETHLKKLVESDKIIIVEGKKDKAALKKLGIKNIIDLGKKPLFHVVEEVASNGKECIILTDMDKKGKELYGKLNAGLQRFGVKVDNSFRNFLYKNTKLRQIEGIVSYINNNE
ncbi:toprim domain-containing protein [Candidatus Woesearchaeota archaeon]|nr:toprim domain-containing protein [Candidatus Woesearchaeota archaeon]